MLKRLPGVTIQGRPGRGGAIRLRGLGSGYTQILLDGERVPPGFSLDSLAPDQIERIEILRAPTAETGARAIAGTINIITREGYKQAGQRPAPRRRLRERQALAVGLVDAQHQRGRVDDQLLALGLLPSTATTAARRPPSTRSPTAPSTLAQNEELRAARAAAAAVHGNGRLQWRGDGGIDVVTLMPVVYYNQGRFASRRTAC